MIKVMIIDDDVMIRDYLHDVIQWDKLNLLLCCEAGDSENARELFNLHHPKIVITDINIPIISGLKLAKEFIETDKDIHILVITGYNDFQYVRDSVSLGAVDLLSKPIDPVEINASLQKAVNHFSRIQRQYRTKKAISELLTDNRELLQERSVAQLLAHTPTVGERGVLERLRLLSLDFPEKHFGTVIIRLDPDGFNDPGEAAFPVVFKQMCETSFKEAGFRLFTVFETESQLNCLLNWSVEFGDSCIEDVLEKLSEETKLYFQSNFSAGIGGHVDHLNQLYISTRQAQAALEYCDATGRPISNYRNIKKYMDLLSTPKPAQETSGPDLPLKLLSQQQTKIENRLILSAKKYMLENLGNPDLSLDSVSSHVGLSRIYFCQLFHKEDGSSFTSYLNALRIDKACSLLRETNMKIFEISNDTGYRNPKYFNYVFKRVVGVTPMEYRNGNVPIGHEPHKDT